MTSREPYQNVDAFDALRVMRELENLRTRGGLRALGVQKASRRRAEAVNAYNKARARVRRATTGSAQAKDDAAYVDPLCDRLYMEAEDAKSAEKYAKDLAEEHELEQSNLQTQSRLIERILGVAGAVR